MDLKRNFIVIEYTEGSEDGWETVRKITRLDRPFLEGLIKKYCGKSFYGKTFRMAFINITGIRYWIKNSGDATFTGG